MQPIQTQEGQPLSDLQENNILTRRLIGVIGVFGTLGFIYLVWLTWYVMSNNVVGNIIYGVGGC